MSAALSVDEHVAQLATIARSYGLPDADLSAVSEGYRSGRLTHAQAYGTISSLTKLRAFKRQSSSPTARSAPSIAARDRVVANMKLQLAADGLIDPATIHDDGRHRGPVTPATTLADMRRQLANYGMRPVERQG